jgi:4-diphosphocytidyl-2-C-methyl-D-erythritol kinase
MNTITVKAYAKLNLSLDCLGLLNNGYHNLSMVMQSIDLCDTVTIEKSESIEVICKNVADDNIAEKSAQAFFGYANIKGGANIKIEKRIPIAAGLAGGSADAAATLVGLNAIFGANLSVKQLCEIGASLGADVPFCIIGGTCIAEGFGEKLTPLKNFPDCSILLIKQGEKSSTGEMYRKLDSLAEMVHPKTEKLVKAISAGDLKAAAGYCENVFLPLYGEEKQSLIKEIISCGALGATLSGSGPSVFGIFENKVDAMSGFEKLKARGGEIFLTKPMPFGTEIV